MKFSISDSEHETLPHEGLAIVPVEGVTFERCVSSRRKVSGFGGPYDVVREDIYRQSFVTLSPIADEDVRHEGVSVLGNQIYYNLGEAINIGINLLVSMNGIGPMKLWIMGREYGTFEIPPGAASNGGGDGFTEFLNNLYHIIDDERGFNPKEWREAISRG